MDMLTGALGALFVIGLLALGALAGWKARGRLYRPTAKPADEDELRRMQAEQEAFLRLQNYSAETAYGIAGSIGAEPKGGSE